MGVIGGNMDKLTGMLQYRWGRVVGNPRHTAKGMARQQKGRAKIAAGRGRFRMRRAKNRALAM